MARLPFVSLITWHMLAEEEAAGFEPLLPRKPLPKFVDLEDWTGWPVLSIDRTASELHIVAVAAARPGALTRLIAGAWSEGLSPVIVCPIGEHMHAILAHWGWERVDKGEGADRREEWRPPAVALVGDD